jgi:hypothetical protein
MRIQETAAPYRAQPAMLDIRHAMIRHTRTDRFGAVDGVVGLAHEKLRETLGVDAVRARSMARCARARGRMRRRANLEARR